MNKNKENNTKTGEIKLNRNQTAMKKEDAIQSQNLKLIKSLIFQAKGEAEVIKVPNCTYANDIREKSKYFLCQCSAEEFYPICEGCAKKCHSHHGPTLELEGVYTCMCGKTNHLLTPENEKRFNNKKLKSVNQCFFTKFMEITPNKGIYKHKIYQLCSICVEYCFNKSLISQDVEEIFDDDSYICKCPKHYELNVINLNVDLISKPKFHFHLQNFNFNILSKIPASKEIYIEYLITKTIECLSSMNEENSKNFFTNFMNYKILELFSTFATRWENKFFHLKNYITDGKPEEVFELLRFKEPVRIIEASKAPDFVNCKFYFAEYLFNYFVRSYQLKFNNLFNIRTILNMNLYQRTVYLHQIKHFQKFNYFEPKKSEEEFANIELLSHTIMQLYEEILKLNEVYDCKNIILSYVFPTFNRIFKYLIKYNIVDDILKSRYFDAVLDSINLANESGFDHYNGSELYIIKSILYCLIYRNDTACIEYLKNGELINSFVFKAENESKTLSKVFITVVNKYNREEDPSKTIIYDYYVRKIFELMIGKNEFFIKNLENMKYLEDYKIKLLLNSEDLSSIIFGKINKYYMSQIFNFCMKLNFMNREYFDYNINYESYLSQVNEILKDFKNFFYNDVNFLPDLTKKYQIFLDDNFIVQEDTLKKIKDLQMCVPYTLLFQKVEEFLHILSEGRTFQKKSSFNISGIQNDYLRILLHFLFLLVIKNHENLSLLMNMKPTVFVSSFIYVKEDLFNFLDIIGEFLFSDYYEYKFDNYYFFTECINAVLDSFVLTNNLQKNIQSLSLLGRVMKISEKVLKFISMDQPDGLNCIERIIEKLNLIKNDLNLKNILHDFLMYGNEKKYEGLNANIIKDVEKFLTQYFSYLNELKFNDLFFLGLIKESDFLIELSSIKTVTDKILKSNISTNKNINVNSNLNSDELFKTEVELEYQLMKFFLQMSISYNFKIYEGRKYLTNLLMKNIPDNIETYSLKFLSKNPNKVEYRDLDFLLENSELLIKVMKIFPSIFNKFSNHNTFNLIEKKVYMLSTFENLILRPLYKLLGLFLSDPTLIKGRESLFIHKMIYYFMFNTVFLYENLSKHFSKENIDKLSSENNASNVQNNLEERIKIKLRAEEIKLLQKIEILDYEDICVKGDIDINSVFEIKNIINSVLQSEIKYFELEKIYQNFTTTCYQILKLKDAEFISDIKNKEFTSFIKVSTNVDPGKNLKVSSLKSKIIDLINFYKDKVSETYEYSLAMISVLDSESNDEIDIASDMLSYLLMKLSDGLTDNNIKYFSNGLVLKNIQKNAPEGEYNSNSTNTNLIDLDHKNEDSKSKNNNKVPNTQKSEQKVEKELSNNYKRGELKNLKISNFKFQNAYCLLYLNLLFFHDSERFQDILEESYEEEYNNLFNFLSCDLIFPCLIREVDKNYDLDRLNSNKTFLPASIALASIKFLQNLCENHNQNFQKKFFNHDFSKAVKIINYPYNIINDDGIDNIASTNENKNKNKAYKKFYEVFKNFLNKNSNDVPEADNEHSEILAQENEGIKTDFDEHKNKMQNIQQNKNPSFVTISNRDENFKKSNEKEKGLSLINNQNNNLKQFGNKPVNNVLSIFSQKKNKLLDLKRKEQQREHHELKLMQVKRVSFFNFIEHCERIIIQNLNIDSNILLYLNKDFKNSEQIMFIYQRFSDLIIEMIQGTENKNFENFYKRLPDNLNILDKAKYLKNKSMLDNFIFIKKCFEIQYLLFNQDPFDKVSIPIKLNLFITANNVINQELTDKSLVNILINIFSPDKLIDCVSGYIKALYVKHIICCDYEDVNFNDHYREIKLNSEYYSSLIYQFKLNNDIFEDEFFKLASQIFLFLTILGEKYRYPEAVKILSYNKKDLLQVNINNQHESDNDNQKSNISSTTTTKPGLFKKIVSFIKTKVLRIKNKKKGYDELTEENNDLNNINTRTNTKDNLSEQNKRNVLNNISINNCIISARFLTKIIYSCEFMIDSPNDEGDKLELKKIYFIIDPRAYLVSKNNIENFFDTVDRTSSTTKIKSLIDIISFFKSEVEFKENFLKNNSKRLKWLLEIEFKNVDLITFCLSMAINIILLVFLKGGDKNPADDILNTLLLILGLSTIFINFICIIFFLLSKYKFYVNIEKSNLENPVDIGFYDAIRVYFINSFLTNDEIYLMIINIVVSFIGIISKQCTFVFSLQLLTVMKFVPTIKEIVIAFKLRITQLASMIAFLGILIFFYSVIGFYFFNQEFAIDLDEGKKGNICKTLFECWITYFNHGVRSGGGIGDLLGAKPFQEQGIYWLRFTNDMLFFITVILLLLNMINGVIVSTFSQIREESNNKEEDINNKCYICNIDRMEFEKRKVEFKKHLKYEHNSKTYIKFFICLGLIHEKDLDADQSFILECIKERDVYIFPVGRSSSIGEIKDEEAETEEDVEEQESEEGQEEQEEDEKEEI